MWQPIATGSTYSESVDSFKLLGVHITKDLSWAVHSNCVIKKASRRLYSLRNLRKSGVHLDDLIIVYRPHVRSVLEYAATAFANLPNCLANDMEKIQKCTLSIICSFTSYKDTLAKAGIESLKQRCEDACVNFES